MKQSLHILTLFILMLVASCSHDGHQMNTLADIDSLTLSNADSARALLMDMSTDMEKASDEVRAYYNLLKVKADDKAFVRHTSDSLICAVAEYYEQTHNLQRLPETYYYIARTNIDIPNSEKALFYLQKTLVQDSTYVSPHLRGRTYAQIGYIYLRNGLFEEAKNMQQLAYCFLQQAGDTLFMRYCTEDIQTIDSLKVRMKVDPILISETKLKIQRINDKLKSNMLKEKNDILQTNYAKTKRWRHLLEVGLILICIFGGITAFVFLKKKKAKSETDDTANAETETTKPVVTRRKFYDAEINELLASHIKQNKVLRPADWTLIEQRLLAEFPEFKNRLFSLHNLSETEYRTCLLIKLEVSPSNMARLMATSNSAVSQSRLRMQQKVFGSEGTAKDWDAFILSL